MIKYKQKRARYGCFGPWSMRPYQMAYAYGYAGRSDDGSDDEEVPQNWQAQREHRGRRGHRRSGNFGVRRPLRYLSYQLDLDESQRRQIAAALDTVKIEREQEALDEKKMVADLADLVASNTDSELSTDSLKAALSPRVQASEKLQKRMAKALKQIVQVLDSDQRQEFAYLLRTGDFRI